MLNADHTTPPTPVRHPQPSPYDPPPIPDVPEPLPDEVNPQPPPPFSPQGKPSSVAGDRCQQITAL